MSLSRIQDHNKPPYQLPARNLSLAMQQLRFHSLSSQSPGTQVGLTIRMPENAASLLGQLPGLHNLYVAAPLTDCPESSVSTPSYMSFSGSSPSSLSHFRLNDLPMELRLQIYREALTAPSGTLAFPPRYLTSRHKNLGLAASLLASCSDISSCATPIIYTSNVFQIAAKATCNNDLNICPDTLPRHVLPRIQHAFLVLDARNLVLSSSGRLRSSCNLCEMTGLRSLGITIITPSEYTRDRTTWEVMLWTVVENVPKECDLRIGTTSDAEKDFVSLFTGTSNAMEDSMNVFTLSKRYGLKRDFPTLFTAPRWVTRTDVEVPVEYLNKILKKIRSLQAGIPVSGSDPIC